MSAGGFYHCSVKPVGRAAGRSVVAAAAYRSGERLADERTGEVFDYRARGGVLETFIIAPENAPTWAQDRAQLWNGAEAATTAVNGKLATEIELALPYELSRSMRKALVTEFVGELVHKHGVAADVALHVPGTGRDHRNYHAHILLTHREIGPEGFGEIANTRIETRRRKGQVVQEKVSGVAQTSRDVIGIRQAWEHGVNRAYERAGLDIRVDHRSHKDRGIEQEPSKHLGPAAVAMEKRAAGLSDRVAINQDIAARNAGQRNLSALKAEAHQLIAAIAGLEAERDEPRQARSATQIERQADEARRRLPGLGDTPPVFAAGLMPARAEKLDRRATSEADEVTQEATEARKPEKVQGRRAHVGRAASRSESWIENRIAKCAAQARDTGGIIVTDLKGRQVSGVEALADRLFSPDDQRQTQIATVYGAEGFAARLAEAGIALVRVTAADVTALTAWRHGEEVDRPAAPTNSHAYKPRQVAELAEGELAAVTRNGHVHRINPDNLGDAKLHLAGNMPSVIEVRAGFEMERAKKAELWAGRRAQTEATKNVQATQAELRHLGKVAAKTAASIEREAQKPLGGGVRAGKRLLGGFAKVAETILEGLFGGGEPVLTPQQAKRTEAAAKERAEEKAAKRTKAEKDADLDHLLSQIARNDAQRRLRRERGEDLDQDRGIERER